MPAKKRRPTEVAQVRSEARQYLVAEQQGLLPFGVAPEPFESILAALDADDEVQVRRVIQPSALSVLAAGLGPADEAGLRIAVASMTPEKAAVLAAKPQVTLEEDFELSPLPAPAPRVEDPIVMTPFGLSTTYYLRVLSPEGTPVSQAAVYLYGDGAPAQGQTNGNGDVELDLMNQNGSTVSALYVNPQSEFWSLWVDRPALRQDVVNTVTVSPLNETTPGFPGTQSLGWGQRDMRLDEVPASMDGSGVRVAVIDSGSASLTHPDLNQVRTGRDLTVDPPSPVTWTDDQIAHGSHCIGVVAGLDDGAGIRGFAPAAEVHALKIFPGGRVSSLFDALDYCIDHQVDVVNMSLGSGGTSELFLRKLADAKAAGVACVVAAGNTGGEVQFPGISPDVLTVAAIGRTGQFPASSYHSQQVGPPATDNQHFSAKFTCHGPEIDVCAPGVAVLSSVPPRGFAAWDGTSMAAPHVTGLAALVLAHHPDFQTTHRSRNAARVDRVFQLLRSSCTPIDVGDPHRTGAGMPDALRALGLDVSQPAGTALADELAVLLASLEADMVAAGLLTPGSGGQ